MEPILRINVKNRSIGPYRQWDLCWAEGGFSYIYRGAQKRLRVLEGTGKNLSPPGIFAGLEPALDGEVEGLNQSHYLTRCLEPVADGLLGAIVRSGYSEVHISGPRRMCPG